MLKVAKIAPPGLPDWSRKFDNPIPIVNGRPLFTLHDAGKFIAALPKVEHDAPRWRTTVELLLFAAEKRAPTMRQGLPHYPVKGAKKPGPFGPGFSRPYGPMPCQTEPRPSVATPHTMSKIRRERET